MAITGASHEKYLQVLEHGGELVLKIDREDIAQNRDFELYDSVRPYLFTGFELPPSTIIGLPQARAEILCFGDDWTRIQTIVYSLGGNIVYCKLCDGRYEAILRVPKRQPEELGA